MDTLIHQFRYLTLVVNETKQELEDAMVEHGVATPQLRDSQPREISPFNTPAIDTPVARRLLFAGST